MTLPIFEGRQSEPVQAELVQSIRCNFPPTQHRLLRHSEGNWVQDRVPCYQIWIEDKSQAKPIRVELYLAHLTNMNTFHEVRGGALETRFFNEEAAWRVGRAACERINRLPQGPSRMIGTSRQRKTWPRVCLKRPQCLQSLLHLIIHWWIHSGQGRYLLLLREQFFFPWKTNGITQTYKSSEDPNWACTVYSRDGQFYTGTQQARFREGQTAR